jgi:hypothetical protein
MPSRLHEALVDMFREQPALVADLLSGPLGIRMPSFHTARASAGDLTEVVPTEYRADAVVTFDVADKPVFGAVIEVQLRVDPRKRYVWPAYVATLYARLRCPVVLLVLCPHVAVADRCAKPIVVTDPGLVLRPLVLGPRQIPAMTELEAARRHPELAVLSAIAHGGSTDPSVFKALFAALDAVEPDRANLYIDLVLTALPKAARGWLEEYMQTASHGSGYQSDFARRFFGQGKAEGNAEGRVTSLLAILDGRAIPVPDDIRAEITTCADIEQLDAWIRRAITAENIQDVLG